MFENALARPLLVDILENRRQSLFFPSDIQLQMARSAQLRGLNGLWQTVKGRHQSDLQRLRTLGPGISSQLSIHGDNSIVGPPRTLTSGIVFDTLRDLQYTADLGLLVHRIFVRLHIGPHHLDIVQNPARQAQLDEGTKFIDGDACRELMNICRPFMDKGFPTREHLPKFKLEEMQIVVYSGRDSDHVAARDQDRLAHHFSLDKNSADADQYRTLLEWDFMMCNRRGSIQTAAEHYLAKAGYQKQPVFRPENRPVVQPNTQPAAQPRGPCQSQRIDEVQFGKANSNSGLPNGNDARPVIDSDGMALMALLQEHNSAMTNQRSEAYGSSFPAANETTGDNMDFGALLGNGDEMDFESFPWAFNNSLPTVNPSDAETLSTSDDAGLNAVETILPEWLLTPEYTLEWWIESDSGFTPESWMEAFPPGVPLLLDNPDERMDDFVDWEARG
ncbi:MAG: hypothetical protein M1812_002086 [Candelaria pacifica]|nr:MAG: hypothetical protein M1812_002086 [Candelaria pacifica]